MNGKSRSYHHGESCHAFLSVTAESCIYNSTTTSKLVAPWIQVCFVEGCATDFQELLGQVGRTFTAGMQEHLRAGFVMQGWRASSSQRL